MSLSPIEKELVRLEKSSKTLFRIFRPLHHSLLLRYRWYKRWHLFEYHRQVHYGVFAAYLAILVLIGFSVTTPLAYAANLVPVQDTGGATVLNTGGKIYFSTGGFGSNVVIDNYSRQMSGFAWSSDLGWLDFGNTGSNPPAPVSIDPTGHLFGQAKVLNTGGVVDFNASPSGSNVVISAGVLSGYAWSADVGWINFSGVDIPSYNPDLLPPDNPTLLSASTSLSGGSAISSNQWYNASNPSFTWSVPTDYANGIPPSGVAGYLVYFGTDDSANIAVSNGQVTLGVSDGAFNWQTSTTYTSNLSLAAGSSYFLKVVAVDNAGNAHYLATSSSYDLFTYKYDNLPPSVPTYVTVSPSGYSGVNSFTFSWPVNTLNAATDTGGSGIGKYQYQLNDSGTWLDVAGGANAQSVTLSGAAQNGVNTFDLRAVDQAGNASLTSVRTNFYFNNTAPLAPSNLAVTPSSNTTNSFAFSWSPPPGEIAGYYYSINALPTASNVNYTTSTSLPAGPYATQQGENTFYIVAKDSAGNYQFDACKSMTGNPAVDGCAKVTFSAQTAAPGIPGDVQAYDISDRNTSSYAVALKWVAPSNQDADFAGYDIYRSPDGTNFSKIGSTTSTIYADGGLQSIPYYYYVVAKDNAGNYSAPSGSASLTPTGRYTSPPNLVSGPSIVVNPTSLIVHWVTDRACSSFVQIQDGNTFVSDQGQTGQTTDHTVKVLGLHSQHDYTYNISSTDQDGNTLTGSTQRFTTANAPSVYDLNVTNITQQSAIINFKSTAIANFTLYYGSTSNYGQTVSENSTAATTNHSISVVNLQPGTTYYFRVLGEDADGDELRSENSFATLPLPTITNFAIQPVPTAPSTTLTISWTTNVPTSSAINYSPDGKLFTQMATADLTTEHSLTIADLKDKSDYLFYASGRDQFGNLVTSDKMTFQTPLDTRPPGVSDIVIESSNIGNTTGSLAQIAVSWKTDEPANSQVEYDTGLSGNQYTRKTVLDTTYTNRHLVIITGLNPGTPYHLRILTADPSGNLTKSGDNTVITGNVSNSALQVILNTMQNLFGWMGNWNIGQ